MCEDIFKATRVNIPGGIFVAREVLSWVGKNHVYTLHPYRGVKYQKHLLEIARNVATAQKNHVAHPPLLWGGSRVSSTKNILCYELHEMCRSIQKNHVSSPSPNSLFRYITPNSLGGGLDLHISCNS